MASSQAAAKRRFSRQLGRLMVLPLSHPAMIITWAVLAPSMVHTGLTSVPSASSMASRWTSSTTLIDGYCRRYSWAVARLRS